MSNEIIVDNIYYSLAMYDGTDSVAQKISYLNTALNLAIGLLLREGLPRPIKVVIPQVEDEEAGEVSKTVVRYIGYELVEIDTLDQAIELLARELAKLTQLGKNSSVVILDGGGREIYRRGHTGLSDALSIIEDLESIKLTLVQLLVTAGYDRVRLSAIGKAEGEQEEGKGLKLPRLGE